MLLLVSANMGFSTKVAFYHKVGTISDNKVMFKYFLASLDPHFYFVVYVVPYEDTLDIFYTPKIDNLDSFSVIPLFEDFYGSVQGVEYGEVLTITLTNEKIHGVSEVVELDISIPDRPMIINDVLATELDMEKARQSAISSVTILKEANLHTLSNQLMITVESKVGVIVDASAGVNIEGATHSIIRQVLLDKSVLYKSLPTDMGIEKKEMLHRIFNTIVALSPYSTSIAVMFSDIVSFARAMHDSSASFELVPYPAMYRLTYKILSTGSDDAEVDLIKASLAIEKITNINLNMSTMEETSKVYELINTVQSFIYLTKIEFLNVETGDKKTIILDNSDPDILSKKKDACSETRSIQAQGKQVSIQYGYGSGCDPFVGMLFTDEFGSFGIIREDKLLDGDNYTSRKWVWGDESLEMFGNEINSSNNIKVTFTGA